MKQFVHSDFLKDCEIEIKDGTLTVYATLNLAHLRHLQKYGFPIGAGEDPKRKLYKCPVLSMPVGDVLKMANKEAYGRARGTHSYKDNFYRKGEK